MAVITLLHFGLGDEIGDLLVYVNLFGRHSALARAEFFPVKPATRDYCVNIREALVKIGGRFRLETGKNG